MFLFFSDQMSTLMCSSCQKQRTKFSETQKSKGTQRRCTDCVSATQPQLHHPAPRIIPLGASLRHHNQDPVATGLHTSFSWSSLEKGCCPMCAEPFSRSDQDFCRPDHDVESKPYRWFRENDLDKRSDCFMVCEKCGDKDHALPAPVAASVREGAH